MANSHFTEELKIEEITDRGNSVADVSDRLGVSTHSLYAWRKRYGNSSSEINAADTQSAEIQRLKQELARVTEERDILKRQRLTSQGYQMKYAFVSLHRPVFSVRAMCRCLSIHPNGFYAWLRQSLCRSALEDHRQTELIRKVWNESGK